jgi:uncharacterized metal-binding protein YceD (DUF177 family)
MNQAPESAPLTRKIRVVDIDDSAPKTLEATPGERAKIADLLDLQALDRLCFSYRLRRGAGGRVRLSGRLEATVTQTCVLSLEPVGTSVDVPVEVEFWPTRLVDDLEQKAEDPVQPGLLDWPEAIEDGIIDIGPVIYETFATALEPYPKKEGASFHWSQGMPEPEPSESGPFAALKQLKEP